MSLINTIFEVVPIFAPKVSDAIRYVSSVADPIDFLSEIASIGLVLAGY